MACACAAPVRAQTEGQLSEACTRIQRVRRTLPAQWSKPNPAALQRLVHLLNSTTHFPATHSLRRFVCRKRLGGRKGEPAAYLTAVPPGAVVYGSGDSAVILSKVIPLEGSPVERRAELLFLCLRRQQHWGVSRCVSVVRCLQVGLLPAGVCCSSSVCNHLHVTDACLQEQASALQKVSMHGYADLKKRLLLATALLTLGGSGVAAAASGTDAAVPFALGGLAGLLYQYMLQLGADAAVASALTAPSGSEAGAEPAQQVGRG